MSVRSGRAAGSRPPSRRARPRPRALPRPPPASLPSRGYPSEARPRLRRRALVLGREGLHEGDDGIDRRLRLPDVHRDADAALHRVAEEVVAPRLRRRLLDERTLERAVARRAVGGGADAERRVHLRAVRLVDAVVVEAVDRVENSGIVFLDDIDKVAGRESTAGPDVSREGVQRDILPIVEGSNVMTKHGMVRTDHILFVAAGAFHTSKPSDLIPELQGRFPIRVSLKSLDQQDFKKILTEPKNALTKQYIAMMKTENLNVDITESAIDTISSLAFQVNESVEDIGASRLHTIMEKLFEQISFDAPDIEDKQICIDAEYVDEQLAEIAQNQDLSRYIL